MNTIYHGDNLQVLRNMPDNSVDLIYIDPPFNTGKTQSQTRIRTVRSENGDRIGFGGNSYRTTVLGKAEYEDSFFDYYDFLEARLAELYRVLKGDGSFYFHIDYREAAYCKIMLDGIFGRENFLNEIIWAYDYGARSKSKWPTKHDTILFYVKDAKNYHFDIDACDRIEYMSPKLVGEEKAALGKTPTDSWWMSIIGTNAKERLGYPTQKPVALVERIINVSSEEGDLVLDCFAGSGTTGAACLKNNRNFILVDENIEAVNLMKQRFQNEEITYVECNTD